MITFEIEMFSLGKEYGATIDQFEDGVLTHSLHTTIIKEAGGWTRNYLMMAWCPPGTEMFPEGDPLKALFPNYCTGS
jgi:hypothetical protein